MGKRIFHSYRRLHQHRFLYAFIIAFCITLLLIAVIGATFLVLELYIRKKHADVKPTARRLAIELPTQVIFSLNAVGNKKENSETFRQRRELVIGAIRKFMETYMGKRTKFGFQFYSKPDNTIFIPACDAICALESLQKNSNITYNFDHPNQTNALLQLTNNLTNADQTFSTVFFTADKSTYKDEKSYRDDLKGFSNAVVALVDSGKSFPIIVGDAAFSRIQYGVILDDHMDATELAKKIQKNLELTKVQNSRRFPQKLTMNNFDNEIAIDKDSTENLDKSKILTTESKMRISETTTTISLTKNIISQNVETDLFPFEDVENLSSSEFTTVLPSILITLPTLKESPRSTGPEISPEFIDDLILDVTEALNENLTSTITAKQIMENNTKIPLLIVASTDGKLFAELPSTLLKSTSVEQQKVTSIVGSESTETVNIPVENSTFRFENSSRLRLLTGDFDQLTDDTRTTVDDESLIYTEASLNQSLTTESLLISSEANESPLEYTQTAIISTLPSINLEETYTSSRLSLLTGDFDQLTDDTGTTVGDESLIYTEASLNQSFTTESLRTSSEANESPLEYTQTVIISTLPSINLEETHTQFSSTESLKSTESEETLSNDSLSTDQQQSEHNLTTKLTFGGQKIAEFKNKDMLEDITSSKPKIITSGYRPQPFVLRPRIDIEILTSPGITRDVSVITADYPITETETETSIPVSVSDNNNVSTNAITNTDNAVTYGSQENMSIKDENASMEMLMFPDMPMNYSAIPTAKIYSYTNESDDSIGLLESIGDRIFNGSFKLEIIGTDDMDNLSNIVGDMHSNNTTSNLSEDSSTTESSFKTVFESSTVMQLITQSEDDIQHTINEVEKDTGIELQTVNITSDTSEKDSARMNKTKETQKKEEKEESKKLSIRVYQPRKTSYILAIYDEVPEDPTGGFQQSEANENSSETDADY